VLDEINTGAFLGYVFVVAQNESVPSDGWGVRFAAFFDLSWNSNEKLGTFQPDHLLEEIPFDKSCVKCDCQFLNAFISVPFDFKLFGLGLSLIREKMVKLTTHMKFVVAPLQDTEDVVVVPLH
jgi:hypothetical protein